MSNKKMLWRKVEEAVADALGLKRVGFSGGVWPNKEDAEDDFDFICQMKATEGKSIGLKVTDVDALVRRAIIQKKIPLFVFHVDAAKYDFKTWVAIPLEEFKQIKEEFYNEKG